MIRLHVTRGTLRSMRDQWQCDLDFLHEVFQNIDLSKEYNDEAETIRNLETAISYMEGVINSGIPIVERKTPEGRKR